MVKYTNEKIINLLKSFVRKVNRKFKLEQVILFGSRARGDYLNISDVDLILVSKDFENLSFRERIIQIIGYWDAYVDIEVLCYTPEEFNRKKKEIGIVRYAVNEGIEL